MFTATASSLVVLEAWTLPRGSSRTLDESLGLDLGLEKKSLGLGLVTQFLNNTDSFSPRAAKSDEHTL